MIHNTDIEKLAFQALENTSLFLVDCKVNPGNVIVVHLDGDQGVSIEDCVRVSRHIEHQLDRETEDFELSVSSSGLTSPLKVSRQYVKNIGKEVKIVLHDGTELSGVLKEANPTLCKVLPILSKAELKKRKEAEKKGQVAVPMEAVELDYEQIKETKIIISFK